MSAWHNNPDLKAEVVARLVQHRAEDSIVQGLFQEFAPDLASGYRGCAIGCTLPKGELAYGNEAATPRGGWHEAVEGLYGIPAQLGYLIDITFEGLPTAGQHAAFAVQVIDAVPVGADLGGGVWSRLAVEILADPERGVARFTPDGSSQRAVVEAVAALYGRRLNGDEPSVEDWRSARSNARHASFDHVFADGDRGGRSAADTAADAAHAAILDTDARAYDAATAVQAAANACEDAYAAEDVYQGLDFYTWLASRLIHHMQTTPVTAGVS